MVFMKQERMGSGNNRPDAERVTAFPSKYPEWISKQMGSFAGRCPGVVTSALKTSRAKFMRYISDRVVVRSNWCPRCHFLEMH